jgi:hypothetical protein
MLELHRARVVDQAMAIARKASTKNVLALERAQLGNRLERFRDKCGALSHKVQAHLKAAAL